MVCSSSLFCTARNLLCSLTRSRCEICFESWSVRCCVISACCRAFSARSPAILAARSSLATKADHTASTCCCRASSLVITSVTHRASIFSSLSILLSALCRALVAICRTGKIIARFKPSMWLSSICANSASLISCPSVCLTVTSIFNSVFPSARRWRWNTSCNFSLPIKLISATSLPLTRMLSILAISA